MLEHFSAMMTEHLVSSSVKYEDLFCIFVSKLSLKTASFFPTMTPNYVILLIFTPARALSLALSLSRSLALSLSLSLSLSFSLSLSLSLKRYT